MTTVGCGIRHRTNDCIDTGGTNYDIYISPEERHSPSRVRPARRIRRVPRLSIPHRARPTLATDAWLLGVSCTTPALPLRMIDHRYAVYVYDKFEGEQNMMKSPFCRTSRTSVLFDERVDPEYDGLSRSGRPHYRRGSAQIRSAAMSRTVGPKDDREWARKRR